jgi:hypothetical protein
MSAKQAIQLRLHPLSWKHPVARSSRKQQTFSTTWLQRYGTSHLYSPRCDELQKKWTNCPQLGLDGVPEGVTDEEGIAIRRAHVNQLVMTW